MLTLDSKLINSEKMLSDNLKETTEKEYLGIDFLDTIKIKVINASANEVKLLKNYFRKDLMKLNAEPDITIKFVDELKSDNMIYLGLNYAGFDSERFYIFNNHEGMKKVSVPFERIGERIEIICEKGINSFPLLNHILNFYLIKKNYVPVHSSGLYFNGKGILVMGWTKGGKTETLLSFASHGAEYVGDEWVVISSDGTKMFGLPVPVTIWKWQLPHIQKLVGKIELKNKIIFSLIGILDSLNNFGKKLKLGKTAPFQMLNDGLPHLKKLLKIRREPASLFRNKIKHEKTNVDALVLAMSHKREDIFVEECESAEIIDRMVNSNDYEQLPFFEFYKTFKYAFPEKKNDFLETLKERHSELLSKALSGKKSFKILHPYPVSFEKLFTKLSSAIIE